MHRRLVAAALAVASLANLVSVSAASAEPSALRSPASRLSGGPPVPPPPEHDSIGSVTSVDYGSAADLWRESTIPVCWENPTPADLDGRAAVRGAVHQPWESHAAIRFSGWGPCAPASRGIRVRIGKQPSGTAAVGAALDGMPNGVTLDFLARGCGDPRPYQCLVIEARHAFGHALGFVHASGGPNAPAWCREPDDAGDRGIFIAPADRDALMNYCLPGAPPSTEPDDSELAAEQFWYGPAPTLGIPWLSSCRNDVTLFQKAHFGGRQLIVTGSLDELETDQFHERAASLCVPAGITLRAFTKPGDLGLSQDFPGPTTVDVVTGPLADGFASLQTIDARSGLALYDAPQACAATAELFQNEAFTGRSLVLQGSTDNLSSTGLDDRVSSLCVPAHETMTIYRNAHFTGRSLAIVGPAFRTNLKAIGWNDAISSVRIGL